MGKERIIRGERMKSALMIGFNPLAKRQEDDYYATNPKALELFLRESCKSFGIKDNVWECACGEGHLSKKLEEFKFKVKSSDKIDRGYGEVIDFLKTDIKWDGDILTNPPFKLAEEFIKKGMNILKESNKLILFLKIQFLESKSRYKLFKEYPIKYVYVHSSRQLCCKDGRFDKYKSTTQFYCWLVFEKGFKGDTILRWIPEELEKELSGVNHSLQGSASEIEEKGMPVNTFKHKIIDARLIKDEKDLKKACDEGYFEMEKEKGLCKCEELCKCGHIRNDHWEDETCCHKTYDDAYGYDVDDCLCKKFEPKELSGAKK